VAPAAATSSFQRRSYPILVSLQRVPRWLLVVVPALLLFAGLVMPVGLGWLGGILLLLVAAFLGWLLLLAWPALTQGSRTIRIITVLAVVGIAAMKALGRF
jgi:hypothetical protein